MITRDEQRALVAEAARAPSVHNIQPARWRFVDDGVVLFRALDRVLPVADPTGHDVQASLGAAFEGMAIAMSRRGWRLGEPVPERQAASPGCEPTLGAAIEKRAGMPTDPLAPHVGNRRAFRGKFAAPSEAELQRLVALEAPDVRIVIERSGLDAIGRLHDQATWTFESKAPYHQELWSWIRLSRRHPCYDRDGLNAGCLALSALARWAAARLLVPERFAILSRLGVARHLVSERGAVRSAAAAILFTPSRELSPFDVGRRFYRIWLGVTALGLNLVPMSASADDARVRAALESAYGITPDRRLANVLRLGRIAADRVATSARLPVDELLV